MQYVILYWILYFKKLNKHFGDNKNILIKVLGYGNIGSIKGECLYSEDKCTDIFGDEVS